MELKNFETSTPHELEPSSTAANDPEIPNLRANVTEFRVCKSHSLARASNTFSFNQYRILNLAISRVDSRKDEHQRLCIPDRSEKAIEKTVFITPEDYSEVYSLKVGDAGSALSQAVQKLSELNISIQNQEDSIQIIKDAKYDKTERYLQIEFTPEFFAELVNLDDPKRPNINFRLGQTSRFDCKYTFKLFDYLHSKQSGFTKKNHHFIYLHDLKKLVNYPESYGYDQTKRRVIDTAIRELRSSGWKIHYTKKERGKRVVGINFIYEVNDNLR